jgi:hypothetical protein
MADVMVTTRAGGETGLRDATVVALSSQLRGEVLRPGHNGYEGARKVWNGISTSDPR